MENLTNTTELKINDLTIPTNEEAETKQRNEEYGINITQQEEVLGLVNQPDESENQDRDEESNEDSDEVKEVKSHGEEMADKAIWRIIFIISPITLILLILGIVGLVVTTYLLQKN
ncbi:hypothetical protein EDI_323230 [Entamoeba dispar SAW760]|uniref:Uncharacterized protein n=1 Tax=Entamoeba dispar (strain ATCC PRA-260 / SAW760) TaxID=370354 RepID=B0EPK3_ENTDS|nr:uncharacterized protein EDI_323230 [Entamoeba dispar SAW760]EDR23540.1 hypothetical protein EDI_323230 [Entamoeba dispar SAW760]|eukprot:EDR23540.1 hypothetical protein EDI_323230 [Entamoeba dispar SAW760]